MKKTISFCLLSLFSLSVFCACNNAKTVTFDSSGGTAVAMIEFETGDQLVLPPDPTNAKLYFAGWYTAANGQGTKVSNGAYLTNSITLYAYWVASVDDLAKINSHTVAFNANGGKCDTTTITDIAYASTIQNLPVPTKEGYSFAGWYTSKNSSSITSIFTEETPVTQNLTLFAAWRKIMTVSFSAPEASNQEVLTLMKVLDKGTLIEMPIPERKGFTFLYWYTTYFGEETKVSGSFQIVRDYTLLAKWKEN